MPSCNVGRARATSLVLTQGEASIELQVGSEEAGEASENLAAGLTPIDLIAAVDQAVGRASIVSLVQHSAEQLPFPDDHLCRERSPTPAAGTSLGGATHTSQVLLAFLCMSLYCDLLRILQGKKGGTM